MSFLLLVSIISDGKSVLFLIIVSLYIMFSFFLWLPLQIYVWFLELWPWCASLYFCVYPAWDSPEFSNLWVAILDRIWKIISWNSFTFIFVIFSLSLLSFGTSVTHVLDGLRLSHTSLKLSSFFPNIFFLFASAYSISIDLSASLLILFSLISMCY